jgi:hypothetical protein
MNEHAVLLQTQENSNRSTQNLVSVIALKDSERDLRTLGMFQGFSGCQLLKIQKQLQKFMNS